VQPRDTQERLILPEKKKGKYRERMIQKRITDSLRKLTRNEREEFLMEEEKQRKQDLTEAKEKLWKKWRNQKRKGK
jgi:hypothetical protein